MSRTLVNPKQSTNKCVALPASERQAFYETCIDLDYVFELFSKISINRQHLLDPTLISSSTSSILPLSSITNQHIIDLQNFCKAECLPITYIEIVLSALFGSTFDTDKVTNTSINVLDKYCKLNKNKSRHPDVISEFLQEQFPVLQCIFDMKEPEQQPTTTSSCSVSPTTPKTPGTPRNPHTPVIRRLTAQLEASIEEILLLKMRLTAVREVSASATQANNDLKSKVEELTKEQNELKQKMCLN